MSSWRPVCSQLPVICLFLALQHCLQSNEPTPTSVFHNCYFILFYFLTIHTFVLQKYLMNTYYVPETVLGIEDGTIARQTNFLS